MLMIIGMIIVAVRKYDDKNKSANDDQGNDRIEMIILIIFVLFYYY